MTNKLHVWTSDREAKLITNRYKLQSNLRKFVAGA